MSARKYKKMVPEIKKKWLKALRSGKFKQTRGRLQGASGKSYCCLGVLEHCVMGVPYDESYRERVSPYMLSKSKTSKTYPSRNTLKKAGLVESAATALIEFNDGICEPAKKFSFIADWIEKNL